jgi:addiction module HigA family antidote
MGNEKIAPVHPGEILLEEFLKPMGISQNRIALDIRVPPRRINEIVHGKRRITADTALRLGRYFGMSAQFWLGLQMDYDLDTEEDRLRGRLDEEVRIHDVSAQA